MKSTSEAIARFDLPAAPATFRSVVWEAAFSPRGLKRLSFAANPGETRGVENPPLISQDDKRVKVLKRNLLDRFKGGRSEFNWDEFDLDGAGDFHRRVWRAMCDIPFGETATYAEIAGEAGSPLAFRACGQACGANRIVIFIPCHRVVSASGLGGFGYGLEWKKKFLAMETMRSTRLLKSTS